MATPAARTAGHLRLLVLLKDVSLRVPAGREVRTGFGFLQAKPSTSFAPAAVTPDELREAWRAERVHLPVQVQWNGRDFGHPDAGKMGFGLHELVAHAARTRNLHAGAIVGSGTISNDGCRAVGSACIAEHRGIEVLDHGNAATRWATHRVRCPTTTVRRAAALLRSGRFHPPNGRRFRLRIRGLLISRAPFRCRGLGQNTYRHGSSVPRRSVGQAGP